MHFMLDYCRLMMYSVATMYIDTSYITRNGKTYCRHLLRESYREAGKVKHRTLLNLSGCTDEEILAMKLALKHKDELALLGTVDDIKMEQGLHVGAVYALHQVAKRVGIVEALGNDENGKLALWQIVARLIDQGSRLSAVRLAKQHAACTILDLSSFDEDDLYANLKWIAENQDMIEEKLFNLQYNHKPPTLYLYDVTSSYMEGKCNAFGFFGYNRDGKKGKEQIVIGLLTAGDGNPVSVRVFDGNTQDTKTVAEQVHALAKRFGVKQVTMVGDRGMLKCPQIDLLKEVEFHYITAITKAQINGLIKDGVIQLNLFDQNIAEVQRDGIRYVLRRNPERAREMAKTRWDKVTSLQEYVNLKNDYLKEHGRAKVDTALKDISNKIIKLKMQSILKVSINDRLIELDVNKSVMDEDAILDGCYVLKTDLSEDTASAQTVHDRYKDLSLVEKAFRTFKNGHLEIQPTFVRKASSTRAHVFVVMLAYMIERQLIQAWADLDITVAEGIDVLSSISSIKATLGSVCCEKIPGPSDLGASLLRSLDIKLPGVIPSKQVDVATRKKLPARRKKK